MLPSSACPPRAAINKSYRQTSTEAPLLLQNFLAYEHSSLPSHHCCAAVIIDGVTFNFNQTPESLSWVSSLKWERTALIYYRHKSKNALASQEAKPPTLALLPPADRDVPPGTSGPHWPERGGAETAGSGAPQRSPLLSIKALTFPVPTWDQDNLPGDDSLAS